jgi:hypothetical protein
LGTGPAVNPHGMSTDAGNAATPEDADTGDTSSVGSAERGPADADDEGFVSGLLRDSTVTGLPGDTGAPPVEPHAPQAQQEGDEPVGSEPPAGDNPRGVD